MATSNPTRAERIRQWEVSIDGEPLFSLDDVLSVNQHTFEIRRMTVPENAPLVKDISSSALPDHVKKCQLDVKVWDNVGDGILANMSSLAGSLQSFCLDSIEALEQLSGISDRIQEEFEKLTERQKEDLRSDMKGIFSSLLETSMAKERESQAMATRLANFGTVLQGDATAAENIRQKYQSHIDSRQREVEEWEKSKGLTPSGDVLKDLNDRIDQINANIKTKESEYIGFCCLLVVGVPGIIIGSIYVNMRGNELKELRTEMQGFLEKIGESRHLNTIKVWLDTQKKIFDDLQAHLTASQRSIENLRGQWQKFTFNLSELLGDTGRLSGLKKDDWLEPLSKFRLKTTRAVYEKAGEDISLFQKNAFRKMPVEVLISKAA